ncbi:hypothetical protein G7066_04400 [Leucobacter coleopterorum]|uniref:Ig-like domain-containing protein n=1 Tax=Leucobacter coleopterorum TaxID=2714933 RepID=A0ABX6JUV9_9MICO|nr:hypothetical protein [Leucobacter coleopterorum]QIM18086.1 hypothetical protein G7066_04400 [Leucobacter coleopterorum]
MRQRVSSGARSVLGVESHAEEDTSAGTESGVGSNSTAQVEEAVSSDASEVDESSVNGYTVAPLQAHPGESVTVTGQCSDPRVHLTDVDIYFYYLNFEEQEFYWQFSKSLTFDDEGKSSEKVTIPSEAYPGSYSITFHCASDDQAFYSGKSESNFTVLGEVPTVPPTTPPPTTSTTVTPEATAPPEELAETGGAALLVLLWGSVVAGALGAGLFVRARYAGNRKSED